MTVDRDPRAENDFKGGALYVDIEPLVVPARITIEHIQLRDVLQPSYSKGKCLLINHLKIDQVDFTEPLKPPTTYCTLDFRANCLSTGHGLLAAGGQASELAIRPLQSSISQAPSSTSSSNDRQPAPWLLRTPTGGSINNSIAIQLDPPAVVEHKSRQSARYGHATSDAWIAASASTQKDWQSEGAWLRDGPSIESAIMREPVRYRTIDEELEAESIAMMERVAAQQAASSSSRLGMRRSLEDSDGREDPVHSKKGRSGSTISTSGSVPGGYGSLSSTSGAGSSSNHHPSSAVSSASRDEKFPGPTRLYISNNDQTLKVYKLRPPSGSSTSPLSLESDLPGLSRSHVLSFPTAVNHSSFSPDGQTLVAVGDTCEVFLYHRASDGTFDHIRTYKSVGDACFSTSWHPDGTKFAVASQDGCVSVWDVRSSQKLAELRTSQEPIVPALSGANGSSGAARVVKFSPCGRYLAFTEHRSYFHIYDTVTYSKGQRIAIPTSYDCVLGSEARSAATASTAAGSNATAATDLSSLSSGTTSHFPESRARRNFFTSRLLLDRAGIDAEESHASNGGSGGIGLEDRRRRDDSNTATDIGTGASAIDVLREASRSLRSVRDNLPSDQGRRPGEENALPDLTPALFAQPAHHRRHRIDFPQEEAHDDVLPSARSIEAANEALQRALLQARQRGDDAVGASRLDADGNTQRRSREGLSDINLREEDEDEEEMRSVLAGLDPAMSVLDNGGESSINSGATSRGGLDPPILRAYSALYSPLGLLNGWEPSTSSRTTTSTADGIPLDASTTRRASSSIPAPMVVSSRQGRDDSRSRLAMLREYERERERALQAQARGGTVGRSTSPYTSSNVAHLLQTHPLLRDHYSPSTRLQRDRDRDRERLLYPEQDAFTNIAGLCWDPTDGDYLYVASERMVCRYRVREARKGSEWAQVR